MSTARFKIFIHVPKTAGTAVARLLEEAYPARIFYDYGTERNLHDARTPQPAAIHNRESILRHYRMIYGHFHHLKYAELFYQAEFVSMVRDPFKRAISHYQHLARYADPVPHPIAERVKSGAWNIIDLHRNNPSLTRVLEMYFEGRAVRDFAFIIDQERLYESLVACAKRLDMPELGEVLQRHGGVPQVNARPEAPLPGEVQPVTDAQREELAAMLVQDRRIYDEAVRTFSC